MISIDPSEVHAASIVIDGTNPSTYNRQLIEQLLKGGYTSVASTIAVMENFKETMLKVLWWREMFEIHSDLIMPIRRACDIASAKVAGKLGIILALQNTAPIEEELDLLCLLKEAGIRIIQLTYNERNLVADGCFERVDAGLTRFGLHVVKKMNELGLLIDLSHVGPKSTTDAIEASEKPVAVTHSSPHALYDYPRNKTDEQIKLLASKGGVMGATFWPFFLKKGGKSTLTDYIDTIDYLVNLVGPDHVAIASDFFLNRAKEDLLRLRVGRSRDRISVDFEWPIPYLQGISKPQDAPNITAELLGRGYPVKDVKKILGENLLRLFEATW